MHPATAAAFQDELEKIAGELQGFTRIGRRPISVDRLLEREVRDDSGLDDVVKESAVSPEAVKAFGMMALGAGAYHGLRRANEDRKIGRQMRQQQQF